MFVHRTTMEGHEDGAGRGERIVFLARGSGKSCFRFARPGSCSRVGNVSLCDLSWGRRGRGGGTVMQPSCLASAFCMPGSSTAHHRLTEEDLQDDPWKRSPFQVTHKRDAAEIKWDFPNTPESQALTHPSERPWRIHRGTQLKGSGTRAGI